MLLGLADGLEKLANAFEAVFGVRGCVIDNRDH